MHFHSANSLLEQLHAKTNNTRVSVRTMNCGKNCKKPMTKYSYSTSSDSISPSVPNNDILRYAKLRKKGKAEAEKYMMTPQEIEFINALMAKHIAYAKSKQPPVISYKVGIENMRKHYDAAAKAKAAASKKKGKTSSKSNSKSKSKSPPHK